MSMKIWCYIVPYLLFWVSSSPIVGVCFSGNHQGSDVLPSALKVEHSSPGGKRSIDKLFFDFSDGKLDWENDWDTDFGRDSYKDFYRVARLTPGYLIKSHRSSNSQTKRNYLMEQVDQITRSYQDYGFWDVDNDCWVERLMFSREDGWYRSSQHRWGYCLALELGALNASLLVDISKLDDYMAKYLLHIQNHIDKNGHLDRLIVNRLPQQYAYAVASLALGYVYFKGKGNPNINLEEILSKLKCIFNYMRMNYDVNSSPYGSVFILRGSACAYRAFSDAKCYNLKLVSSRYCNMLIDYIIKNQRNDGSFYFSDSGKLSYQVQRQLKTDIALIEGYQVTHNINCIRAVKYNIDWIIKNRFDVYRRGTGDIMWQEDDSTSFFECHQAWFAIATKLLEGHSIYDYSYYREKALGFLTDDNFAGVDMYLDNYNRYGTFFSYRAISLDGTIQKLKFHKFKGAYEIGASLYNMALNYDMKSNGYSRLVTQPAPRECRSWDRAIFCSHNLKSKEWSIEWETGFAKPLTGLAVTGLFNSRSGDWRILFSAEAGLVYKNADYDSLAVDSLFIVKPDQYYKIRCDFKKSGDIHIMVYSGKKEVLRKVINDVAPFDSCYFGMFQYSDSKSWASNVFVDNLLYLRKN